MTNFKPYQCDPPPKSRRPALWQIRVQLLRENPLVWYRLTKMKNPAAARQTVYSLRHHIAPESRRLYELRHDAEGFVYGRYIGPESEEHQP